MADISKTNGHNHNLFQTSETEIEDLSKSHEPSSSKDALHSAPRKVQRLSDSDLSYVRYSLGAPLTLPTLAGEPLSPNPPPRHSLLKHLWPPHSIPEGLYKQVLTSRYKSQLSYYLSSTLYNSCLILQLLLGACITALSSSSISASNASAKSTAITVLAAANTVNAGLVALLHNSGLPGRLRNDWNEFEKAQMHLLELLQSGIVPLGQTKEEAVDAAFRKYGVAKETVRGNKPTVYAGTENSKVKIQS